jgi:hypothetical protein
VSSGFGDLTTQAHQFVAAGDLAGAQELLGAALNTADPSPAHASPELTEAAGLQARVLVALGEPHSARGWASFAYSAATRLYGQADQRTVATAATLAAVLHRVGSHDRAARLYREVIIELTATDGPESLRVLAAHADLATVEYAQGECRLARNRLEDAWELHREVYGDGHLSGIRMLARLGSMQRDCGHFAEAHEHLALARELCREHLPADHPLASQVAALARAAANPDHSCADGLSGPPTGSVESPARVAPTPTDSYPAPVDSYSTPDSYAAPVDSYSTPDSYPARVDSYPPPAARPPVAAPPTGSPPPPPPPRLPPPRRPPARVPPPRLPFEQGPAGSGASSAEAGYPGVDPDHVDRDNQWWPPENAEPGPEDEPSDGRDDQRDDWRDNGQRDWRNDDGDDRYHDDRDNRPDDGWDRTPAGAGWDQASTQRNGDRAPTDPDWDRAPTDPDWDRASAGGGWNRPATGAGSAAEAPLPLAVPGLASNPGAGRESFREPGIGPDRISPAWNLPERRQRAGLPVRIYQPPRRSIRRNLPVILAGLVVVLLGTVAVVAGFALTGDPEPEPARPTPPAGPTGGTPSGPPASATPGSSGPAVASVVTPGTPPAALALRDSRDSVALTWTYPPGAEGPVVVSAGRTGQDPRAIADLPAGADSFVIYALNRNTDYCFTVAVVYSVDLVGRAKPVCTSRVRTG